MTHEPWLRTYAGRHVHILNPRPADIYIQDIAHALAHTCRFAGHTPAFYAVAQHSVLVSELLTPDLALWGLLHDASEAYLHDLTRPLKRVLCGSSLRTAKRQQYLGEAFAQHLVDRRIVREHFRGAVANTISTAISEDRLGNGPTYGDLETRMTAAICDRFGLPREMPSRVKTADDIVLATEFRDLFDEPISNCIRWASALPMERLITPLSPQAAKDLFLLRFEELTRRAA
jgi:hypothetical protein